MKTFLRIFRDCDCYTDAQGRQVMDCYGPTEEDLKRMKEESTARLKKFIKIGFIIVFSISVFALLMLAYLYF